LRETFKTKNLVEWEQWLQGKDVCWAPVNDLKQGFDHPHTKAREMLIIDEHGNEHIGVPIKFRHEPAKPNWETPGLGEHNEQVTSMTSHSYAELNQAGASLNGNRVCLCRGFGRGA
jgi:crotonobetainyl-CoA:carnitine CoA-transferase CaiB-like acyl-CoA transferase